MRPPTNKTHSDVAVTGDQYQENEYDRLAAVQLEEANKVHTERLLGLERLNAALDTLIKKKGGTK